MQAETGIEKGRGVPGEGDLELKVEPPETTRHAEKAGWKV
jgi:hypothetical protein